MVTHPRLMFPATAAVALAALALPAAARANATVSRDAMTDVVTVTSTAAENNDILVFDNSGTLVVQESDPIVAGLDAGAGCSTVSAKVVNCGVTSSVAAVIAHLGPGNDVFRSTASDAKDVPRRVDGEAGNDQLFGSDGNDRLDGGAGNDVLDGGAGTDTISYDRLSAATVTVRFPDASDSPATVNGATVGTTTGNGESGENDTVTSRDENFQGGAEADDVTGNSADNVLNGSGGDDTLKGLGGNDTLQGVDGNDALTGGGGTDAFSAGTGDDAVSARDGVPEPSIDCGTGTGDRLEADNALDTVDKPTTACETLAPQRTSGTGTLTGATQEGDVLTAPLAAYSGDAVTTRAYTWLRCTTAGSGCTTISGQTARTYTLTAADVGRYVSVTETATNPAGTDNGFADYVGPVAVRPATSGTGGTGGAGGAGGSDQPVATTSLPTPPPRVDPSHPRLHPRPRRPPSRPSPPAPRPRRRRAASAC